MLCSIIYKMDSNVPIRDSTMICLNRTPEVNSHGLFNPSLPPGDFLKHSLPLLELQMTFIFVLTTAIKYMLRPVGASLFVSAILAGICLSPTWLGRSKFMGKYIFPLGSQHEITTFGLIGYTLFLFLGAVRMDVGTVLRTGRKARIIGILSVTMPFLFGMVFRSFHENDELDPKSKYFGSWNVILVHAITSFPVVGHMVGHQLQIGNSELGRFTLSVALISDLIGISMIITLTLVKEGSWEAVVQGCIPVLVFIFAATFIFRPALNWVIRRTPERKPVSDACIYIILAITFASEVYFKYFHRVPHLGPFILGLAVPAGAPLGSALEEKFECFSLNVLFNILTVVAVLGVDLSHILFNFAKLKPFMILIFATTVIKHVSTMTPALLLRMPFIDAMAISIILNHRSIVQLYLAVYFNYGQKISQEVFALVVVSILINAAIIPLIIRSFYDPSSKFAGYESRNVRNLKAHSELKILACIHRPDNIHSIIRLLDASNPAEDQPVGVYVLHLIKLVGRTTPLLISHSKQKAISNSSSQNVIHAFSQYEQAKWGTVSFQFFTAISTYQFMHDDICNLALEKLTSLIIIPLHRKWSIHGTVQSEDRYLRTLNTKVLEKAPCSVGILFERGRRVITAQPESLGLSLSICVIFIGGKDDREALSLANRMARDPKSRLTVVHFIAKNSANTSEDKIVDIVSLNEIKQKAADSSVKCTEYTEHTVEDGRETIKIIRTMAQEYDLFLLGRRRYEIMSPQTAGLSDWSEIPELGVIGDFFASKDLETKSSVLVVQQ